MRPIQRTEPGILLGEQIETVQQLWEKFKKSQADLLEFKTAVEQLSTSVSDYCARIKQPSGSSGIKELVAMLVIISTCMTWAYYNACR